MESTKRSAPRHLGQGLHRHSGVASLAMGAALSFLTWVGSARSAMANGIGPDQRYYSAQPQFQGVKVCMGESLAGGPRNPNLSCTASKMLRQNVATGEVVQLAPFCEDNPGYAACFIDECVPKGQYRYGLASPFDCSGTTRQISAEYYAEAYADFILPDCMRSQTNTGPVPYPAGVPWTDHKEVCHALGSGSGCAISHSANAATSVISMISLAAATLLFRRRRVRT